MTNNSSENINDKVAQKHQELPLIPPAKIRTPSHQHVNNKQRYNSIDIPTIANEQNMKSSEVSNPQLGTEVWSSIEDLFWDHMKEVQNKWSTLKLNDDIWAKLIYFEQNRRLAKAYVSAPVLTIDGSTNGLDGFRIGLSGIDNTYRSLSSTRCLRSIGQGVKLKIDNQGNILIRKVANGNSRQQQQNQQANMRQCSIWVKDWPGLNVDGNSRSASKQSSESLINENCSTRELEKSDVSYKLFDMRKFRLQLEKRRLKNDPNHLDWRQCVSIISFVRNNNSSDESSSPSNLLLDDPCWIMLINIIAIDMLKSSINCDRDNNLSSRQQQTMGSSNLIHQHALLESTNNRRTNDEPTRTSSSASILSPTSASTKALLQTTKFHHSYDDDDIIDLTNNIHCNKNGGDISVDSIRQYANNLEMENNLMLATSDRIKKLRTANNRYRMSPLKSESYYRKYQSTQQLSSANNTIYTTFDSKFINSKPKHKPTDLAQHKFSATDTNSSSTSDYNSVSRSTSSGNYWRNQQPFQQLDSLKHRLQHQRNGRVRGDEGIKLIPGQGFLTTPFEPKSISLSTFDLSLKPLDLRSSIKMNYDNVDEHENTFGHHNSSKSPFGDRFNEIPSKMHSRRAIVSSWNSQKLKFDHISFIEEEQQRQREASCCACCGVDNDVVLITNDKSSTAHVNNEECQSNQNKQLLQTRKCTSNNGKDQIQPQKASRSSIDSSSSSSGCADNDYFISHSSSSMSSSTESNERELLSQPASSSGIACSGNTSDEYDDNQKHEHQATKSTRAKPHNHNHLSGHDDVRRSSSPKNKSSDDLAKRKTKNHLRQSKNIDIVGDDSIKNGNTKPQNNKKGSRIRSLGTNGGYCCDSGLIDQAHDHSINSPKEFDCDCPSIEVGCDCCCDCFVDQPLEAAKPLSSSSSSSKNALYEDESIYCRLPFPTDILQMTNKNSRSNSKTSKTQRNENTIARVPSNNKLDKIEYEDGGDISNIPDATKASKQSNCGWLEKRRYSRILPKFIFSSSSNSNNNNNKQVRNSDKNTQRKSNTLDRGEKFTLFKSTYEL